MLCHDFGFSYEYNEKEILYNTEQIYSCTKIIKGNNNRQDVSEEQFRALEQKLNRSKFIYLEDNNGNDMLGIIDIIDHILESKKYKVISHNYIDKTILLEKLNNDEIVCL